MSVRQNLGAVRSIITAELHGTFAWRASMLFSAISGPLFILVSVAIWKGFFATSTSGVIGGFTYEGMITYFVLVTLIQYLMWNDLEFKVSEAIGDGTLSQYLLKPYSFFTLLFYRVLTSRIVAFGLEFLPVLAIILVLGIPFTIVQPLWFIALVALSLFINYCTNIILGMFGFWLTKPRGLLWAWIFLKGFLLGMFIPLSVFPLTYQKVISYTPFPYFMYIPSRVAMGLPVHIGGVEASAPFALLIGVINAIVLYAIMHLLWVRGVKRYTGVGQ